ncbi:MAG TPA: hypothetical protein VMO00_20810 [Methylomirabilota bacterium]|nr:hypothetical protein [Methylomirabilota bacterium]
MASPATRPRSLLTRRPARSLPIVLATFGWLLLEPTVSVFSAEVSSSWKTAWEKTVVGAKKEGQITVYGSDTFALGVFVGNTETAKAISVGLPIGEFSPGQFKEGAAVSPFNGTLSLINRAPHPNAAKVLINWLLSREGQAAVQQHLASEGSIRESLREDIAKDVIPSSQRRDPKVRYIMISRSADLDSENEAIKLANDALAGAKKK